MNGNYITLHRKIQNNPIWLSEKFTRGQAWVDLIMLANHSSGYILVRGNRIELERGDVGWSILRLSERWQWSRTRTTEFATFLEKEKMICQKKYNRIYTVISIINYNLYQPKLQQTVQQTVQQKDNRPYTNNKDIKNNKNIYSSKRYLLTIPKEDIEQISTDLGVTEKDITFKGKQLFDWCEANGKVKKNYRAFLRTCLRQDHSKSQPLNLLKGGIRYEDIK